MNMIKATIISAALIAWAGCFPATDSGAVQGDGGVPGDDNAKPTEQDYQLVAYRTCASDDECGGANERCRELLGASVCVVTGCALDAERCGPGQTCMVSERQAQDGICANTGRSDFCGQRCGDPLQCNFAPECVEAGCCDQADDRGCPSTCANLNPCSCVIDPRCPETCCGQ
ncbi:MAG: hypothetical protein AAGC55_08645 [Myxococcota bacterium]